MTSVEQLEVLSQYNIEEVNKEKLVNLLDVKINKDLPEEKRMLCYLEQIKNPYCFLVGDIPVKISFSDSSQLLSDILINHFISTKQ